MGTFKKYIWFIPLIFVILLIVNYFGVTQDKKAKNSCIESGCHEMVTRGWYKHAPVKDDCSTCHDKKKGNHPQDPGKEYELTAKIPDLCTTCHDITKGDKSKHMPADQGECLTCHDPHTSDKRNLMIASEKPLCLTCHDVTGKDSIIHGPVKKNECSYCHEPHNSKFSKLLRDDGNKLCLKCHDKEIKVNDKMIEDINVKLNAKYVHEPVSQGCDGCHKPHSSVNKALLTTDFTIDSYVYEKSKIGVLCFTCHSNDILAKDKPESTNFRNDKKNLHFVHVSKEKSRNCNICHDVHGSDLAALLKQKTKYGKWMLPINFVATEGGGTCNSGCHESMSYTNKVLLTDRSNGKLNLTKFGRIEGKIQLNSKVDPTLLQGLGILVCNADSSVFETIYLDKNLSYKRDSLPFGKYSLTLNSDDIDELYAKPNISSLTVDVVDTGLAKMPLSGSFVLKIDSLPARALSSPIPKDIIKPNVAKNFGYRSEKAILETKGMNNYLNSAIDYLLKNPKFRIAVTAHTDNSGTTQELQKRSDNMAKSIENYLVKKGIAKKRILAKGRGALSPVQSNSTEKGRSANRRIEINVLK